jgi:hypothetical protein
MIHPIYPKEIHLAAYALMLARQQTPKNMTREEYRRCIFANFCYSFFDYQEFLARIPKRFEIKHHPLLAKTRAGMEVE